MVIGGYSITLKKTLIFQLVLGDKKILAKDIFNQVKQINRWRFPTIVNGYS
jgi:hypothetical protein